MARYHRQRGRIRRLTRVLVAAGLVLGVAAISGCGADEPTPRVDERPNAGSSDGTSGEARRSLPAVASAVPQPDPVAATLGTAATVTGANLFGTKSAKIEITLGKPSVLTEVKLKTGVVQKPKQEVFVVFPVVIEGVDGTYDFNPLHFHLIRSTEVAEWRGKPRTGLGENPDEPAMVTDLDPVRSGSVSAGDRLSGNVVFDQPRSALAGGAVVLRSLLVIDGPASVYWNL